MAIRLMKPEKNGGGLDQIDIDLLALLQANCKLPLARIGKKVGLTAPSVVERIKKLEDQGVILGYRAALDARKLGKGVTAFIGVLITHPKLIEPFVAAVQELDEVLECHHVTGQHSILLKVKTESTSTLEHLISRIRSIRGVGRTETMIALSTPTERLRVPLDSGFFQDEIRPRRANALRPPNGGREHIARARA